MVLLIAHGKHQGYASPGIQTEHLLPTNPILCLQVKCASVQFVDGCMQEVYTNSSIEQHENSCINVQQERETQTRVCSLQPGHASTPKHVYSSKSPFSMKKPFFPQTKGESPNLKDHKTISKIG